MLQQCNHPNVVRYLGSYQGEEYLWVRTKKTLHDTAFLKPFLDLVVFCL